jgi:hypothetical protein
LGRTLESSHGCSSSLTDFPELILQIDFTVSTKFSLYVNLRESVGVNLRELRITPGFLKVKHGPYATLLSTYVHYPMSF